MIPVAEPDLTELESRYVREAVDSGWVSSIGEFVTRFEEHFARLVGVPECVSVSNGTVALHLALAARRVGPGDEVIVPDLTFAATAAAVRHVGATPVLVDCLEDTWCIDPSLVDDAITEKTRAVIPVHLLGHPSNVHAIREVCTGRDRDIFILEDAAEAHGARVGEGVVGSLGDAAAFSFYGNKLITTGEGGCLTTSDRDFAARLRFFA